jgi:uncharacterized membrane protein
MDTLLALLAVGLLAGALLVPWVAVALAVGARREIRALREQLARLSTEVARLTVASVKESRREVAPVAAGDDEGLDDTAEIRVAPVPDPAPAPPPRAQPAEAAPRFAPAPAPATPTPSPSAAPAVGTLEERLGARLPVWLGGIALALAGIFLVQYSIDRGWLSPAVRVALGILFGLALLALGELLRTRSARIAQALSAAGIADLYACFLAASSLYGLLPRPAAFALMALNTALAVALSLRQGPLVAVLGLAGGFLTPALLRAETPSVPGLVGYLLLLQVGTLVVTRRRGWTPLAGLSVAGGILWVLAIAVASPSGHDAVAVGLFLLASGATAAWAGLRPETEGSGSGPFGAAGSWLAAGGAGAGLLAYAAVTGAAGYGGEEWALLALLAGGCLLLARLAPGLEGLGWLGSAAVALTLAGWATRLAPADAPRFVLTGAVLGLLLTLQAYVSHWGAERPSRWTWLSTASALVIGLVVFAGAHRHLPEAPWSAGAFGLALLFLAAAAPLARRRATLVEGDERLAALAVAVTAFATAAGPLELGRWGLTVAWALEVAALLALAVRLRVPVLARLAAALAAVVATRLLLNPFVLDYPLGERTLLNGLLSLYGVPLVAFVAAAILAARAGRPRLAEALGWGAVVFGTALATLEIRHAFGGGDLQGPSAAPLLEAGAVALAWAALGLCLLAPGESGVTGEPPPWWRRPLRLGGWTLLSAGLVAALLGPGLLLNPLHAPLGVGATPLANHLLWLFGGPLAAALAGLRLQRRPGGPAAPGALAAGWSLAALALAFLLVTLEVRQLFHGARLDTGVTGGAERLAYSAAWIGLGLALLLGGLWRRDGGARSDRALRRAGLAVMLLAVLKVFLVDLSELAGLLRVLSFLGLGASLLVLAALYQRVVGGDGGRR